MIQHAGLHHRLIRIISSHYRLLVSVLIGGSAYEWTRYQLPPLTAIIVAWDIGVAAFIILAGSLFWRGHHHIAANATQQTDAAWLVFSFALVAAGFSFAAVFAEAMAAKAMVADKHLNHLLVVVVTLLLSWLATHILFAIRYAHEYYEPDHHGKRQGGLEFPQEPEPDYWDFLYFALVLGMTFQVSDVQITARTLRRLAIVHGLLSFLFNTIIVALMVNIAASLI